MMANAKTAGFNSLGLEPGDVDTLDQIATTGDSQMSDIASGLRVDPSTATQAVERLVQKGLVTRRSEPNDKRVTLVSFTAAGLEVLTEARERRTALATRLLARFSQEDQETIGRLWPMLADAISAELATEDNT